MRLEEVKRVLPEKGPDEPEEEKEQKGKEAKKGQVIPFKFKKH